MEHSAHAALFQNQEEKWLLILGSDWGASSGVPLPLQSTRWSPSIGDLVRYELFRTQSREVFESAEKALSKGRAPLGFISDKLDEQEEWLDKYISELRPQVASMRLADLAKSGMFQSVVSSSASSLFTKALELLEVPYAAYRLEAPDKEDTSLPILLEHDDLIFQDTEDRRRRESTFMGMCFKEALPKTDAILILGHHPTSCDLMNQLLPLLAQNPEKKVVWVAEKEVYAGQQSAAAHAQSPLRWFVEKYPNFHHVQVQHFGDFLDQVANVRQVISTPLAIVQQSDGSAMAKLLNKTFDVRPILIYVPGMALFSGLLSKLPELSVKTILSLFALLALILGILNFQTFRQLEKRLEPLQRRMANAQRFLYPPSVSGKKGEARGKATQQDVLNAQDELKKAQRTARRIKLPSAGAFAFPFLESSMRNRLDSARQRIGYMHERQVLPRLYRFRLTQAIKADPLLQSMGHFSKLLVFAQEQSEDDEDDADNGNSNRTRRRVKRLLRPLSSFESAPWVVMYYKSSPFLQAVLYKRTLKELKQKRLPLWLDLASSTTGTIKEAVHKALLLRAGTAAKDVKSIPPDAFDFLLKQGLLSLYVTRVNAGGNVASNLAKVRSFLSRFPKSRVTIAISRTKTRDRLARLARRFTHLEITNYQFSHALDYLRQNTSYRFARQVYDNTYLRWNLMDPLILSLLIDYYLRVGVAPKSLGVVYDRLLQTMLSQGKFGFVEKFEALRSLAYATVQYKKKLTVERAIRWIALKDRRSDRFARARQMLDEIVQNGVLYLRAKEVVRFTARRFKYLFIARTLDRFRRKKRRKLLLRSPQELTAFYAGVKGDVNALVGAWLRDYETVHQALSRKNRQRDFINPFLHTLNYTALAISNGTVKHAYTKRLEQHLMEQMEHKVWAVQRSIAYFIAAFSTPRLQQWVIQGLAQQAKYDHRLLHITASTSNDIYTQPIKRWLRIVCSRRDARFAQRFKRVKKKTKGPRPITDHTAWGIVNAMTTLAQIGSPDAVAFLAAYTRRKRDPRFSPNDWRFLRYFAALALLRNRHFDQIRALRKSLEANPQGWSLSRGKTHYSLFAKLNILNDKETVAMFLRLLAKPLPLTPENVRIKQDIANALSRMDLEMILPPLQAFLKKKPASGVDPRPFASLAIALKGHRASFSLVQKVALAVLKQSLPGSNKRAKAAYANIMNRAVSTFGHAKAFSLYQTMRKQQTWRALDPKGSIQLLRGFRLEKAEKYVETLLYCGKNKHWKTIISVMGQMRTQTMRARINRSIRFFEDGMDAKFFKGLCPKASKPRWNTNTRLLFLSRAIRALSQFRQYNDIARFAHWSESSNVLIQRAAMQALANYRSRQASDALSRAFARNNLQDAYIAALKRQRLSYNSSKLMNLLRKLPPKDSKRRGNVIFALQQLGDQNAMLQLYPLQSDRMLLWKARYAVYHISSRFRGKFPAASVIAGSIDRYVPSMSTGTPPARNKRRNPRRRRRRRGPL